MVGVNDLQYRRSLKYDSLVLEEDENFGRPLSMGHLFKE